MLIKFEFAYSQYARKVGDPDMPLPWSQHSLKKQQKLLEEKNQIAAPKSLKVKNPEEENKDNQNDDPQLKEFMEVMLPRSKAKLWSNDTSTVVPMEQNKKASKKNIKVEGGNNKNAASPLDETDESESGSSDGEAVTRNLDSTQTASDMDYFRSKVKTKWSDSESDEEDTENKHDADQDIQEKQTKKIDMLEEDDSKEGNEEGKSDVTAEADQLEENEDFEAGRLFVRNLPYTAT